LALPAQQRRRLALWIIPAIQSGRRAGPTPCTAGRARRVATGIDALFITLAAGFLLLPLTSSLLRGLIGLPQMPVSVWQAARKPLSPCVDQRGGVAWCLPALAGLDFKKPCARGGIEQWACCWFLPHRR